MRFADEQVTAELRALIYQRFQQESSRLGTHGIGRGRDEHGEYHHFRVGNRVFILIKVYDGAENQFRCHITVLDGPDVPSPVLVLDGNTVWLTNCPAENYQRALQLIRVRLVHGYAAHKLNVPYGYVRDGIVTAIWFSQLAPGNVPNSLSTSAHNFVLEGHEQAAELLLPPPDADPGPYVEQFWQLVRAGTVVELRERVVCHDGDLMLVSTGVTWPYVYFTEPDPGTPLLPHGQRYLLRSLADPIGGDLPRTREKVANWLRGTQGPASLSDLFSYYG